jgi:HAD superfamily hydrolase (TIGR01509 family)
VTLFADVDLLCLDAGNTVIFLDHARLARLAAPFGCTADAAALVQAEGRAKVRAELGTLVVASVPDHPKKQIVSWASMVATILVEGGLAVEKVQFAIESIWPEHVRRNLWSLVPDGLAQALVAFRATGRKVALVSNSEGMLENLFHDLGIRAHFDVLLDSGILGIEKPDPAIFRKATDDASIAPARALHLGDVYATDIVGARAAGIRCALIDPYGHYTGRHEDVPRVESVEAAIGRILTADY